LRLQYTSPKFLITLRGPLRLPEGSLRMIDGSPATGPRGARRGWAGLRSSKQDRGRRRPGTRRTSSRTGSAGALGREALLQLLQLSTCCTAVWATGLPTLLSRDRPRSALTLREYRGQVFRAKRQGEGPIWKENSRTRPRRAASLRGGERLAPGDGFADFLPGGTHRHANCFRRSLGDEIGTVNACLSTPGGRVAHDHRPTAHHPRCPLTWMIGNSWRAASTKHRGKKVIRHVEGMQTQRWLTCKESTAACRSAPPNGL